MLVAGVGVENGFKGGAVADLAIIHRTNPLFHRHYLVKIDLRVSCEDCYFYRLDLVVESLDFIGAPMVQVLVKKWNVLLFEHLAALFRVFFEEARNPTRMNDLIAGAKSQVKEGGNWYTGHEERLGECVADVVNIFNRKSCRIECLLRPNDPDILPVIDNFADEGDVLEAKDRQLFVLNDLISQDVSSLQVKSTLTED